jgi:hypothetical protein
MINMINMNNIYYDNEQDLEERVEAFKQNISKIVSDNDIDKWTWSGCGGESYGIQYSCPVEEILKIEILKLTKNQNPEWAENISQTIGCAIRATAFSIDCMDKFGSSFQQKFKDREICNIMTVKLITGILFNDMDAGECDDSRYAQLYKIVNFRCCEGQGRFCNCD